MSSLLQRTLGVPSLFGIFLFAQTFFVQPVFAQNAYLNGTTIIVYSTAQPGSTGYAAIQNSYRPLEGFNAIKVIYKDISRMNGDQVRDQMVQDVATNPSTTYFMGYDGHGDTAPGSTYVDGPLDREQFGYAINNALVQNRVTGSMFENTCGAGATCSFWEPTANSAINGVFTSTQPGVDGRDINVGSGWLSEYAESIKTMLNNAGKGGPNDADLDGDGVLSGREVGDHLNKLIPGRYKLKPGGENEPLFFKDKATAEKYNAEHRKDYGKKISVTTNYLYDRVGNVNSFESYYIGVKPSLDEATKQISEQKQLEFVMNSYTGKGQYVTLGGVKVGPGEYTVGTVCQDNTFGSSFDKGVKLLSWDENAFEECKKLGLVGSGSIPAASGAPSATSPLGANSLLPALLSGLLSQGLGGGGQQGQNQGQPYGNDALSLPLNCAQQAVSPVCGEDGKTYNNSCYLSQQRVTLKSQGVCASPSPSPTPAVNASAIVGQLSQSGIPSSLVDSISNIVASVVSKILSGALTVSETVVR